MNKANVDAIATLLRQMPRDRINSDTWGDDPTREDAAWLAAQGVLVPASLTDDDCRDAVDAQTNIWEIVPRKPADFRETLNRIAKGGEQPVRERKACASLTAHEWEPTEKPGHYRCRLCPATQRRGDGMG